MAITAVVAAAITGVELALAGAAIEGFRAGLRSTARLSLVLFLLTFVASSINVLGSRPSAKLLLRYRKYLGNAFAASHLVHLATIFGLMAVHAPVFFAERSLPSLIPGVVTYSFIVAMVITSFERPARALGRRRWLILHRTGMYVIFGIFLITTGRQVPADPLYAIPAGALLAALALRVVARSRRKHR